MEQKNEPTTGEIVRLLEETRDDTYDLLATKSHRCQLAIDRLESQEKQIAELTERLAGEKSSRASMYPVMLSKDGIIAELTARAESAERERDAAKKWATSEWYYASRGL